MTNQQVFGLAVTTSGLTPNTSYYRVRGINQLTADYSAFNTPIATYTLVAPLTLLVSTVQTVSSLQLGWQSSNSIFTRVEISSSVDNFTALIATPVPFGAGLTNTTTIFYGLTEKATYYFRARPINENGLDAAMTTVLATQTASINPEGISNLSADSAFATNDGEIRWTWTAPGGDEQSAGVNVTGYIVRYATFDIMTSSFDFNSVLISTYVQNWSPTVKGSVDAQLVSGLNWEPHTCRQGVDYGQHGSVAVCGCERGPFVLCHDVTLSAPANPVFSR